MHCSAKSIKKCDNNKCSKILKTCFDKDTLIKMIILYNNHNKGKDSIVINMNSTDEDLWYSLKQKFQKSCGDDEWCWLDQDFIKDDVLYKDVHEYLKPRKPFTPHKWLSTKNINQVLEQYEYLYKDFIFLGTVPIDFEQIYEEYSKLDLCRLYNGYGLDIYGKTKYKKRYARKFGFVINLDNSKQKGSHWVSLFMDLNSNNGKQPYIGYFDSLAKPPPQNIKNLMLKLKKQYNACFPDKPELLLKINKIKHQYKYSECGVYAIYFIYMCIIDTDFETITNNIIRDEQINMYRDFFYRPTLFYKNKDDFKF